MDVYFNISDYTFNDYEQVKENNASVLMQVHYYAQATNRTLEYPISSSTQMPKSLFLSTSTFL